MPLTVECILLILTLWKVIEDSGSCAWENEGKVTQMMIMNHFANMVGTCEVDGGGGCMWALLDNIILIMAKLYVN